MPENGRSASTTTCIGSTASFPYCSATRSLPSRTDELFGRAEASTLPVCNPSAGTARASRATEVSASAATGLAMTARANPPQRRRARSRLGGSNGMCHAAARAPSRYNTAGRTTRQTRIATTTTMIAATAIERINGKSTMSSVVNAAATVAPEAATVRPAVFIVLLSAAPRSRLVSSSMNRRIMMRE